MGILAEFAGAMASGYRMLVRVEDIERDVANNRTKIRRRLIYEKTGANYWHSSTSGNSWEFEFNGVPIGGSFTYAWGSAAGYRTLYDNESWVTHDNNGNLTLTVYGKVTTSNTGTGTVTTRSVPVPSIPRASGITLDKNDTTGLDAGTVLNIGIQQAAGTSYTHTLRWRFNEGEGTIASGVTASNYAWTVPVTVLQQIPNDLSWIMRVYVDTYSGTTKIGESSQLVRINVPASGVPQIGGATVVEAAPGVAAAVGAFVQNISRPTVTMTGVQGYQGSTIVSSSIEIAGQVLSGTSGTFPLPIGLSGTVPIKLTVTDSRGRTTTTSSVTMSLLAYAVPRVPTASIQRTSDAQGNTPSDSGTYVRIDLESIVQSLVVGGSQKNVATYTLYYRGAGTTGPYAQDSTGTRALGSDVTKIMGVQTLIVDASREYQLIVADRFTQASVLLTLSANTLLDLDGSFGVGVRKKRVRGAFDILGDVYLSGRVYDNNSTTQRLIGQADMASQAQAEAGTVNSLWMSPLRVAQAIAKALLDRPKIARGRVTAIGSGLAVGANQTYPVTFPAGLFSAPPVVTASSESGRMVVAVQNVTATGCSLQQQNNSNAAGSQGVIHWTAVEA